MEMQQPEGKATPILPAGAQLATTETVEFARVVQESKEKLQAEAQDQVKGKRGRKPLPRDANGNIIRPGDSSVSNQAVSSETPGASMPVVTPEIDIKPMLREGLQLPFDLWATHTNIPELKLSNEESENSALALNQLVNLYLPEIENMDPKKVAAWSFALSMGMIVTKKMQILAVKKTEISLNTTQQTQQSPNTVANEVAIRAPSTPPEAPVMRPGDIDGASYFSRPQAVPV